MRGEHFEVVVAGLRPADGASLEEDLTGAAIHTCRPRPGESLVIDSRRNAVFSADDVLEVLAEWIGQRPERMARTSIVVRRAPGGSAVAGDACCLSALRLV